MSHHFDSTCDISLMPLFQIFSQPAIKVAMELGGYLKTLAVVEAKIGPMSSSKTQISGQVR